MEEKEYREHVKVELYNILQELNRLSIDDISMNDIHYQNKLYNAKSEIWEALTTLTAMGKTYG